MADVTYVPDGNQANNILPWMLAAGNGGWGNGGFFGGNGLGAFIGGALGAILPNLFGWGNGGFGFGGNGGANGAAAALGAQATANNNTDLIMQAINGTDADVRALASANGTDFASVKADLNVLQSALASVGSQVGMSGLQIINAIQSGDASLASKLCECCCNMKQLVTEQGYQNQIATLNQTNALGNAISAASQRNADDIADLKATVIDQFCGLEKRELQGKIDSLTANNTLLRSQIDNAAQTSAIAAMIAPIAKEVDDIKCKLPNTVSVNWPNLMAVNTTPTYGYNMGYGYGVPGGSYWG